MRASCNFSFLAEHDPVFLQLAAGRRRRPDDPMEAPLIATVRFELFPTTVSGKSQGYLPGVRPNHYIHALGCTVIGQVDFAGDGSIAPGESKEATVTYVYWEPLEEVLQTGLVYEVREGRRRVGKVEVLKVERRA